MSRLYLIRHGKTWANEQHIYCGSTDLPLSPRGIDELTQLHYDIAAERYLTSGMRRTNETLRCLFGNVPFEEVPAFREIDFGTFELCSYDQLKDDSAYQEWISGDNDANVAPGGESGEQVLQRVLEAMPVLEEQDTVLVTHGGIIAIMMQQMFPEEDKSRYDWQPEPGCGYAIEDGSYKTIP